MATVSHPATVLPTSEPDMLLSARVLAVPAPPVSAVMFAMSVWSSVRLLESAASVIPPLIVAPLSTTTLSQPLRPWETTVACRLPEPPLNFSVSAEPAPPSNSVMFENVPPSNVSVSVPPPSLTLPAIEAPVFTVTAVLPAPPMIALGAPVVVPTDAPLPSRMVTVLLLCASVLIAATWPSQCRR